MTTNPVTPRARDRALALRTELAWLRGDHDILHLLAAQAQTAEDVDLFIMALLDSFSRVLCKRLDDPVGYLEGWIALEQAAAATDETPDSDVS